MHRWGKGVNNELRMKAFDHKTHVTLWFLILFIHAGCRQLDNIVTSEEELLALLNSQTYQYYDYGELPITDDIMVVGTVTIPTDQLTVPQEWVDRFRGDCRDHVGFFTNYDDEGIDLSADSWEMEPERTIVPATLKLTDIVLRFRPLIVNTHPGGIKNHTPIIFLMPPSYHRCADNQTKCDNDNVCYLKSYFYFSLHFSEYCLYCLGLSHEVCACTYDDGTHLPDGLYCEYSPPGDLRWRGVCQDGSCIYTD